MDGENKAKKMIVTIIIADIPGGRGRNSGERNRSRRRMAGQPIGTMSARQNEMPAMIIVPVDNRRARPNEISAMPSVPADARSAISLRIAGSLE